MSESIKGRVALVTGASQGLGRVIARMLAKEGCKVVVNCAHSPKKAEAVALLVWRLPTAYGCLRTRYTP